MAKAKEVDPGELSEKAWGLINEALAQGVMTLPSGRVLTLDTKDFVRLAQWLAQQKAKKPKVVATPEDFNLSVTDE